MSARENQKRYRLNMVALAAVAVTVVSLWLVRPFVPSRILSASSMTAPTVQDSSMTAPTVQDDWIIEMHRFSNFRPKKSYYKSQASQDEYFRRIFTKIGTTNRYFVEFGFNERSYTSGGSGANTWNLYDQGWRGLLLDANFENPAINLHAHYLFGNNIADIFSKYSVPKEFDLLSCDMDSHDLFVFAGILQAGYRPRVITTEYNCHYPLILNITQVDPSLLGAEAASEYKFKFLGCAFGASAGALQLVASKFGYQLVGNVHALDLVWMRNDLIRPEWTVPNFRWFFKEHWPCKVHLRKGLHSGRELFDRLLDYGVFDRDGDLQAAQLAAERQILSLNSLCFNKIRRKKLGQA